MFDNKNCTMSSIFATARIYALFSIVSAHLLFPDTLEYTILNRFGTIGVVMFLIMSGYFFRPEKFSTIGALLRKKFITVCVPWFFMGTLTWVYKAILTPTYRTVLQYISWIFGHGSYLYYMPVLMLCFIVMYKAPKFLRYSAIALKVFSIILTAAGVLTLPLGNNLNPFNWLGFFALGMLLQSADEETIVDFLIKYRFYIMALFAVAFTALVLFPDVPADYFSFVAIPYELLGAAAFFSLSTFVLKSSVFKLISNYSFSIYLGHMIFVGLFDGVMSHFAATRLLAPTVIIAATAAVLFAASFVAEKIKLGKFLSLLTGIRK